MFINAGFSNLVSRVVTFMYCLYELRDAHKADKTLFLGVSVREFLEEINVRCSRLSKEIRLTKVDGHHSIPGVEGNRKANSLSF